MFSTSVKIPGTEDQGKLYIVINLHCTNQAVVEVDSLVRQRPEQCVFTHSTFIVCETLFLLTILFKCVTLSVHVKYGVKRCVDFLLQTRVSVMRTNRQKHPLVIVRKSINPAMKHCRNGCAPWIESRVHRYY